jgi:ATP:corrinoid adenosyltransferase
MDWTDPGKMASVLGTALGYLCAGLAVAAVTFYKLWSKLKLDNQTNQSETGALQLLDKAVEHWKDLNTEAWAQVKKERQLREEAERRADVMAQEMEGLRDEIASLRREVTGLKNVVAAYQKGDTNA